MKESEACVRWYDDANHMVDQDWVSVTDALSGVVGVGGWDKRAKHARVYITSTLHGASCCHPILEVSREELE